MLADALLDFCGMQTQVIGDLIEPWKSEHDSKVMSHLFEKLIPRLREGCRQLEEALPDFKETMVRHHGEHSILELGTKYHEGYLRHLALCESVIALAHSLIEEGFAMPSLPALEATVDQFQRFIESKVELLPRIRPERLALSMIEHESAHYSVAREFFDELRHRSD
jgi:hypothetical protein